MVVEQNPSDLQAVAHDLRSSLRAIAIYSDLLAGELQLEQLNRSKIELICSSISEAIDTHADHLRQMDQAVVVIDASHGQEHVVT